VAKGRSRGALGPDDIFRTARTRRVFSSVFIASAMYATLRAEALEGAPEPTVAPGIYAIEADVVSAIASSVMFLEATVNEWYQDAADAVAGTMAPPELAMAMMQPVSTQAIKTLAEFWTGTKNGFRLDPLAKYQLVLLAAGLEPLKTGEQLYQRADLVVDLRNYFVHYKPEWLAMDDGHKIAKRLAVYGIARKPYGAGVIAPDWPDRMLTAGLARWCCDSVIALVQDVAGRTGLKLVSLDWPSDRRANQPGRVTLAGAAVDTGVHRSHRPGYSS
jgi:hypothetical protein